MRQNRAQLTRTRLVRAAAELFDQHGYAGTNMASVAARAEVTKGALYFHFATKADLVRALNEESWSLLRELAERVGGGRAGPVQALIDFSHGVLGPLRTEPVLRATMRVARECGDEGEPFLDFYLRWAETAVGLLRAASRDEWLAPDIDVDALAALLLALHIGADAMLATADPRLGTAFGPTSVWRMLLPGVITRSRLGHVRAAGSLPPAG